MTRLFNIFCVSATLLFMHPAYSSIQRKEYSGYIIRLNKDTIYTTLLLPVMLDGSVDLYRMGDHVKVVAEDGKKHTYNPEDLLGYSVAVSGVRYQYDSRITDKSTDSSSWQSKGSSYSITPFVVMKFVRRLVVGAATLYVYETTGSNGPMMMNAAGPGPAMYGGGGRSNISVYFIEEEHLMYRIPKKGFIKRILPLMKGNETLKGKISTKEYRYRDLETIVKEYNQSLNK